MSPEIIQLTAGVAVLLWIGVCVGIARKAKPLGQLPYRWGIWMVMKEAATAVVCLLLTVIELSHTPIVFSALAYYLLLGLLSGFAAVGLFSRQRYGVVLAVGGYALLALCSLTDNMRPVFGFGSLAIINFLYFRKRWPLMGHPEIPLTASVGDDQ
jgi:hypothetical protein